MTMSARRKLRTCHFADQNPPRAHHGTSSSRCLSRLSTPSADKNLEILRRTRAIAARSIPAASPAACQPRPSTLAAIQRSTSAAGRSANTGRTTCSRRRAMPPPSHVPRARPRALTRRNLKHRSQIPRDPPPQSCSLRAHPSPAPFRRVPAARAHRSPAATAQRPRLRPTPSLRSVALVGSVPARSRRCPAPRRIGPRRGQPHRPEHPRAIVAGSWSAASTRRGPAHCGQTNTSMPNTRRSRSAHGKRCRRLR